MTTTAHHQTLAQLRALAPHSPSSITDLLRATEHQAQVLHELLAAATGPLRSRLIDLTPTVCVDVLDAMPVPGVSFWGNGRWHIHLRAGDPAHRQDVSMLHELKHIIDYPLRRDVSRLRPEAWEVLADYFAERVLQPSMAPTKTHQERSDAYEENRQHDNTRHPYAHDLTGSQ